MSDLKRKLGDEDKRARTPSWVVQLETQGFAVIPAVLTQEECEKAVTDVNHFFAQVGIDIVHGKRDYPHVHSIVKHFVGHAQFAWNVRMNKRVRAPFEAMYGTNDLLVSYDGVCVMQKHHRPKSTADDWWLHTDQSPHRKGLRCIQGYVNLTDSSDSRSGSLYVVPGSHLRIDEFVAAFPDFAATAKGDWFKMQTHEHREFFGAGVRVHGGVGSMVLWDSRCLHQAKFPDCADDEKKPRYVQYVCYQPRSFATQATLKKKALLFDTYRMTSHWPSENVHTEPLSWQTYGKPKKVYNPHQDRVACQEMLELAGKVPMTSQKLRKTTPLLTFVRD